MSLNKEFYAPENYDASVPRAWHDLSTKRSFTPQTGMLIPVYNRRMYAGDEFKISVGSLLQTINPLTYPLLDCFELRLEYYYCPLSNYYGWMDGNTKNTTVDILTGRYKWTAKLFGFLENDTDCVRTGIYSKGLPNGDYEDSDGFGFSHCKDILVNGSLTADYDFQNNTLFLSGCTAQEFAEYLSNTDYHSSYNPPETTIFRGSLMETLGVPAGMQSVLDIDNTRSFDFNLEPLLCYIDIWRTYHANTQYNTCPISGYIVNNIADSGQYDVFYTESIYRNIQDIDKLLMNLRYKTSLLGYTKNDVTISFDERWYSQVPQLLNTTFGRLYAHLMYASYPNGGYFPVQYRPDIWRNILSSNIGSVKSQVFVHNGVVTIDEFRQSNKIQRLIDAIDLSGGRYSNLLKTIFGWNSKKELDIPKLIGCTTHLIDPSNITSMADSNGVNLGQMGAKIDKYNSGKEFTIKADDDGYVMICASIIPRISYSQGVEPNAIRTNFADDFDPNMQRLGFQDVPRCFLSVYPSTFASDINHVVSGIEELNRVVGKLPAWIYETTDVNRTFGEFSSWGGIYSPMVLQRNYTKFTSEEWNSDRDVSVTNSSFSNSPYVSLHDNRDIFAEYMPSVSPWSLHLAFNIKAKRPIGKRYRPNLE